MKLEQEKEMVAEKLMGCGISWYGKTAYLWYGKPIDTDFDITFSPESKHKWWPEIFDKLWEKLLAKQYVYNLCKISNIDFLLNEDVNFEPFWILHTAKPELCWKALVKTLTPK